MSKTDEVLRARFAEAIQERDAIFAKTTPLREKRDGILAKARQLELTANPVAEQIAKIEADGSLFELCNEIGQLARALRPSGQYVSNTAASE